MECTRSHPVSLVLVMYLVSESYRAAEVPYRAAEPSHDQQPGVNVIKPNNIVILLN
jgi:hypothetical protein